MSLREISTANPGTNHVNIARRAKKLGWTRDLSAKIKAKADELVTKQGVTVVVTNDRSVSDRQVIEVNAQAIADIRLGHRTDIARARRLALEMLSELEVETSNVDLFNDLGDMLRSENAKGVDKRNDIYMKVISSAGRVESMKKLAEALNILITLERKAWGIQDGQGGREDAADNLANRMETARKRALSGNG